VIVPSHKVPNVNVKSTRLDTTPEAERSSGKVGAGDDGFRTDSQISGGRGIDRGLVKAGPTWTSAGDGGGGLGGDAPVTTMTSAEAGRKGADALNWRAAAARGGRSQAVYRRRWRGGGWPQGRGGGTGRVHRRLGSVLSEREEIQRQGVVRREFVHHKIGLV
jgi:hypothetical protein